MSTPSASSATLLLAQVLADCRQRGGVDVPAGQSVRQLAGRAGVSPAQLSRIENGQVRKPSHEILVALARALNRNPLPLLVLAGHLQGAEARDALRPLFRDGAELPGEWGDWTRFKLDEVRSILLDPGASEDDVRAIAADVFRVEETDETLWDDSYQLGMARGQDASELRELMSIWRYIGGRRKEFLEYGRALRRLTDLEYLADTEAPSAESSKQTQQKQSP
jgi:transcriptional regulator with XRE-family HTH domain